MYGWRFMLPLLLFTRHMVSLIEIRGFPEFGLNFDIYVGHQALRVAESQLSTEGRFRSHRTVMLIL
jgi:hypothetical protein